MVYKGLGFIAGGRVPHSDYVYVEAISKGHTVVAVESKLKEADGVV